MISAVMVHPLRRSVQDRHLGQFDQDSQQPLRNSGVNSGILQLG
jgi:hypothetical protein